MSKSTKTQLAACAEPCNDPMPWGRRPYACEHIAALKARLLGEAWAQEALREIGRRINRRRR